MALSNIIVPPFPDVPAAPGLPPVLRQVGAAVNNVEMLTADVVSIVRMFQGPQWGIFDQNGGPVLIGDSVISVDYRKEYRISDYPIEEGAFASYNKVQDPFDVRVVFACTGKQSLLSSLLSGGALGSLISGTDPNTAARTLFLQQTDTATAALDLYTVVTPEVSYPKVNIIHHDYRREAKDGGATMLRVEVWCREVRAAAKATQTGTDSITDPTAPATAAPATPNAAQPDGASAKTTGTVQGQPVPAGGTGDPTAKGPPGPIEVSSAPVGAATPPSTAPIAPGVTPLYGPDGSLVGGTR
jgi:hypothetical protein